MRKRKGIKGAVFMDPTHRLKGISMKISKKRQVIIIEALRVYRDMQVSMKIDTAETNELLNDIRKEKERIDILEKQEKPVGDQRNPQTGAVVEDL